VAVKPVFEIVRVAWLAGAVVALAASANTKLFAAEVAEL
jgi:hypothetical protein